MKTVHIYRVDDDANEYNAGDIHLGDDGKLVADRGVQRLLHEPIFDGKREIHAMDDPEAFINNLHRHYKSAYLHASKPIG